VRLEFDVKERRAASQLALYESVERLALALLATTTAAGHHQDIIWRLTTES